VQPERKIVQEAWMAVIEAHGLSKRFGATLAVDDLSFAVEKGKVVGFLGPNGAGKTTTLRMLLGLVTPTAGTASINGQPYRALSNPGQRVGAVLEASGFHPGRTARNHLHVVASAANLPAARVQEVLEWLGLSDRRAADRRVGG
jgi:ABC-2 type transport system ATP-binding protein